MNQNSMTNITHFPDDKGAIPASLPAPARKLAENLGRIIASVTSATRLDFETEICCWGRFKNKPCRGEIEAGALPEHFAIVWHCPECGDRGSISDWENTFWDCDLARQAHQPGASCFLSAPHSDA